MTARCDLTDADLTAMNLGLVEQTVTGLGVAEPQPMTDPRLRADNRIGTLTPPALT
jgi:hypothetical protein